MACDDALIDLLRSRLGCDAVLDGAAARERGYRDWSETQAAPPNVVIRPSCADDVAAALGILSAHKQPVSVQGGLTGLAGGANPQQGEMVLSLERLNRIEEIDEVGGIVVAQAGVTLQTLQDAVAGRGWTFPIDFGARGSAQLGGNAATNAGGNRVLRYGMMRENILGLEVALADGTLLTMLDRVIKNNTGLDLKHLFIGSEGTLGVVTRLSLRLVPLEQGARTAMCALPDFSAATRLLRDARRDLAGLSSFELMWSGFFDASLAAIGRMSPFAGNHSLYALIETSGADEAGASAGLDALLEQALGDGIVVDAVLAQSIDQAQGLWTIREGVAELLNILNPKVAFDFSVPLAGMGAFVDALDGELRDQFGGMSHLFFGHLGDGNVHLLSGPIHNTTAKLALQHRVYAAVQRAGGSISAEHGIGFVKRPFLSYSRSPAEVALMRTIKAAVDPRDILGRGRIFEEAEAPIMIEGNIG